MLIHGWNPIPSPIIRHRHEQHPKRKCIEQSMMMMILIRNQLTQSTRQIHVRSILYLSIFNFILIFASTDGIDPKILLNNSKLSSRQRPRPSKRKLQTIPTTNLLQTLSTTTSATSRAENLLDFDVARHLHLDEPCNLLTNIHSRTKDSLASLTPINDIRYEIVDMFTKGTTSHLQQQQQQQQQQQVSPLPSIASLMNRHSSQPSPVVSPTKQTIGINTDPLTTSTTNILHQPVATS